MVSEFKTTKNKRVHEIAMKVINRRNKIENEMCIKTSYLFHIRRPVFRSALIKA